MLRVIKQYVFETVSRIRICLIQFQIWLSFIADQDRDPFQIRMRTQDANFVKKKIKAKLIDNNEMEVIHKNEFDIG